MGKRSRLGIISRHSFWWRIWNIKNTRKGVFSFAKIQVDGKCKKVYKGVEKVGKRCRKGVKIHLFLPNLSYDTYNHLMTTILLLDKLWPTKYYKSAKVNVYQSFQRSYLDHKNHMISHDVFEYRFHRGSLYYMADGLELLQLFSNNSLEFKVFSLIFKVFKNIS